MAIPGRITALLNRAVADRDDDALDVGRVGLALGSNRSRVDVERENNRGDEGKHGFCPLLRFRFSDRKETITIRIEPVKYYSSFILTIDYS